MKLITIIVSFALGAFTALGATAIWAQQSGSPVPCTFTAPTLSCDLTGITAAGPQAATATAVPPVSRTPVSPDGSSSNPSPDMLLEMALAWRGDSGIPHEVILNDPMGCCYSWGQHATEDTKSIDGSHSVNIWIAALRSFDQVAASNVRLNIRRVYGYIYTEGVWKKIYDGNLANQWLQSSNADTSGGYQPVTPKVESDGSLSFAFPAAPLALHMAQNAPGLVFNGADAVVTVVEARLLGTGDATWGIATGADFRDADGGNCCDQSGWGHLILLTHEWKTATMLSSSMTDEQIRATNPPF